MKKIFATIALATTLLAACGDDNPDREQVGVRDCPDSHDMCASSAPGVYETIAGEFDERGSFFRVEIDGMPCVVYTRGSGDSRTISIDCDWGSR